jgi:hypothetical protein
MRIGYQFLEAKIAYGLGHAGAEQLLSDAVARLYSIDWPDMDGALQEVASLKAMR